MPDPHRSSNSDSEKRKAEETEGKMHLDRPVTHEVPMDVDTNSFFNVSDEDNDSSGSEYDDMAEEFEENQVEENLIQMDSDGEPANTTGTNSPHFPSVPSAPPTQARGSAGTIIRHSFDTPSSTTTIPPAQARGSTGPVNRHPLIPPSSTTTIPPTQARGLTGSNFPHALVPSPIFPMSSTQTRSSNGTNISRPLGPPTFATIAAPPQAKGSTPSSPQLSPAARGGHLWQTGLLSSDPPPPVYTPSPHPLCVICNERPAYNDGRRAFPTCGNTCARALEAAKKTTPSIRSSNHSYSSGGSNGHRPTMAGPHQTRQTAMKMCDVCHVRPKYQKNGKFFSTCGLTCAAQLQRPGSVEMCEFCGETPKAMIHGQKFPHCGTTCRDKAKKVGDLASANNATCKTCIICWQADSGDRSDFCTDECAEVADKKAPFLLELPRGHVAFNKVSDIYTSGWKNPRTPCPRIKKVYMVVMKPDFAHRYDDYRMEVSPSHHLPFKRRGNEKQVWLDVKRDRGCEFGNTGNMEPCSSKKCILCSLVRSSLSKETAQYGIGSTPSLARAIEMSSQIRKKTSKVVVLANVLFGRETEMSKAEVEDAAEMPPHGYDSVNLVRYTYGYLLGKTESEDSQLVFDGDAVKPLYLITHE